jgi:hypothetical protein
MSWTYKGELVTELPECEGFVYLISNKIDSRQYIGKKLAKFSKTSIKTVTLKSGEKKKKRVKSKVESDWMKYWSSSIELQNDVKTLGEENFTREILHYCQTKGECSYMEMKEQIVNDVLLQPDKWYNAFVGGKIHRNHVKNLFKR